MSTLLSELLQSTLFGISGNAAYDILKRTWERVSKKTWATVYFESFQQAVRIQEHELGKYGDGTVEILVDDFRRLLWQEVSIDLESTSYSTITSPGFEKKIAQILSKKQLLLVGGHTLDETDYEQLIHHTIQTARAIFRADIMASAELFKEEVLLESENNRLLLEQIRGYLALHYDISIDLQQEIHTNIKGQSQKLDDIIKHIDVIKSHLGLSKSRSTLVNDIETLQEHDFQKGSILTDGVCRGYRMLARPESYFLAQEFNSESRDLKHSLFQALQEFSLSPLRADDLFESGLLLCKISGLIQSTLFGVYQLSRSQNRNVYLELGIALGLGKPFILIKDLRASVAPLLEGLEYYPLTSYLRLRYEFGKVVQPFLAQLTHYRPTISGEIPSTPVVIVAHGDLDVLDFSLNTARAIYDLGLTPSILGRRQDDLEKYFESEKMPYTTVSPDITTRTLDQVVKEIASATISVFRIDKKCSPDSFLALGIALGMNRPVVLVHKEKAIVPTDLHGISTLSFNSFKDLNNEIGSHLKKMIE